jgi:aryl-alcohol dehydrogenase-like predicted oxidoreductase
MKQRRFGKTELQVSEVALGALELGAKYGIGEECGEVPPETEVNELLRTALDVGVNLFDTAGIYGLSEYRIGQFLRTVEQRPVLTTKLNVGKSDDGQWLDYATERPYPTIRACVDHQVQRSLRNLGVDHVDVMQLHGLPPEEAFDEVTAALSDHVQAGRIRFLGASCGGGSVPKLVEAGVYSTLQLQYNMLAQGERHDGLKLAREHDLGVIVRIPLALGVLADKVERLDDERKARFAPFLNELRSRLPEGMTVPEAALRFVLSAPEVAVPLVGTRRVRHLQENARAGDGQGLPRDVLQWLYDLDDRKALPEWSWAEHFNNDWPSDSGEANLELCRSVDFV